MPSADKDITIGMTLEYVLKDIPQFVPSAYYDKHLDAIRVQTMDCSIWEERLDRIMTIYRANHFPNPDSAGYNDVVGFSIKGVRHLLHELGVPTKEGPVAIAALLDLLIKKYPSRSTKFVAEFYRSLSHPELEQVQIEYLECPLASFSSAGPRANDN